MCSIYGAVGRNIDDAILTRIKMRAMDRGRDGHGEHSYSVVPLHGNSRINAVIGSWRATPTTEIEHATPPPYGGIVHNGTIANDRELGNLPKQVDSFILQSVLSRTNVVQLASSLERVKGSYALGIVADHTVYLATNYKPVHYAEINGTIYFASMERHLALEMPRYSRPQVLAPYTAIDLLSGQTAALRREHNPNTLVIASSGLDSTTAAYLLRAQNLPITLLHFSYGCHAGQTEADRMRKIAEHLKVDCVILPLDYSLSGGTSPLLTSNPISDGVAGAEFANEWVPARNLLMIATAVAYAEANGFGAIALGNNLEEAGAYPDNEEQFTHLLDTALDYAVSDGRQVRLLSPVGHLMKHEIVKFGLTLGVPFEHTWSCYRGGETHCGRCGPCTMRALAFERNGIPDPAMPAP